MTNKKKFAAILFTTIILVIVIAFFCRKDEYKVKLCKTIEKTLKNGDSVIAINSTTDFMWDSLYIIQDFDYLDSGTIYERFGIHVEIGSAVLQTEYILYAFFYKKKLVYNEIVMSNLGCILSFPNMVTVTSNNAVYEIHKYAKSKYKLIEKNTFNSQ